MHEENNSIYVKAAEDYCHNKYLYSKECNQRLITKIVTYV